MDDPMMNEGSEAAPDKLTICIKIDAEGQISVGAEPPEGEDTESEDSANPGTTDLSQPQDEESAEKSYMKPVGSIKEALQVAGDLLRNAPQVQAANSSATMGGDAAGGQSAADAAFAANRGK